MIRAFFSLKKLGLPLILAGLLLLMAGPALSATIELLNDGFEKPVTFESWDGNGITNWLAHPDDVHSGTRSARANFSPTGVNYLSSDDLPASDAVSIDVSFWFNKTDVNPTDFTLYYCYGADVCSQVDELDPLGTDGVWMQYTDTIIDSQYFTSTFFIRFDGTPPHSEHVYVDDVLLTKETGEAQTLTVSKTGTGSGTVTSSPAGIDCGADCSESYNYNTVVTLSAAAAAGSTFTGWSGSGCSGTRTCVVTMDAAKSVTATFAQDEYTLTVNVVGYGTVAKDPDQLIYHYGNIVQLTATPAKGWALVSWSGDLTGADNPDTILMDGDKTVTATFTQVTYYMYLPQFYK